jgi:GT2 family glycosyltransferase
MEISAGEFTFAVMPKATVVILNWNSLDFLRKFLPAFQDFTPRDLADIVIIDNGSTDESLAWIRSEHPDIRTIELDRNHGYSGGYALGLEQVVSEYAVLINSDVEVTEGWIIGLLDFMDSHPKAGAVAPKILSHFNRNHFEYAGAAGGCLDAYGFPFCRGRIFNAIEEDHGQYDTPAKTFWASGACLLVRMEAYRKAGGLDPHFFAHMEEIDLCWRMQSAGFEIWYAPTSKVYHVGGGTLPNESPYKLYLNFRNNLLLLHKNLPQKSRSRVLFLRMILDGIAAIQYLVKFKPGNFSAVLKAHRDFKRMVKLHYQGSSLESQNTGKTPDGLYRGSIVVDFFIKGVRTFDQIRNHR